MLYVPRGCDNLAQLRLNISLDELRTVSVPAEKELRKFHIEERLAGFAKKSALMVAEMIATFKSQIQVIDGQIRLMYLDHTDDNALQLSIPGAVSIVTTTIQAFVEDISRFSSARELCYLREWFPRWITPANRLLLAESTTWEIRTNRLQLPCRNSAFFT